MGGAVGRVMARGFAAFSITSRRNGLCTATARSSGKWLFRSSNGDVTVFVCRISANTSPTTSGSPSGYATSGAPLSPSKWA